DRAPSHGRRMITFIRGLAGRGQRPTETLPPAPPQTPPKEFEQTTTDSQSSPSPEIVSEQTPTPNDPAITELVTRTCRLIPKMTPGQVATAIGQYSAKWIALALDRVEQRNRTPGKKAVRSWGFVLG